MTTKRKQARKTLDVAKVLSVVNVEMMRARAQDARDSVRSVGDHISHAAGRYTDYVLVQSVPDLGGRWVAFHGGGRTPRSYGWRDDGPFAIYYTAAPNWRRMALMAHGKDLQWEGDGQPVALPEQER